MLGRAQCATRNGSSWFALSHSAIQPFLAVLRCRDPTTNTATFPPTPTIRPSIQMDAELMTMFQALVARVSAHGEIAAAALRHQVLAALK